MPYCPECGEKVSDSNNYCFNCGYGLGDKKKESEEEKQDKRVAETFYTQPHDVFSVKWDKFKNGIIEKSSLSRYQVPDVVIFAIRALRSTDIVESVNVRGNAQRNFLASNRPSFSLMGESLELNLREKKYKGIRYGNPKNFYITVEVEGKKNKISEFINAFAKLINRYPWELEDWLEFRSQTGISKDDVVTSWRKYLNKEKMTHSVERVAQDTDNKGKKYGNWSIGCSIGALFIFPPILMIIGIILGGLAIDSGSPGRGIVGIILSILLGIVGMIMGIVSVFF